jgi:hypothetical protein
MLEIILWLVVLGVICFIFLILRFFQPELIYTLRQAIVKVEINKALLDMDADKDGYEENFQNALSKDFRSESRRFDRRYVHERLQKVKELYHLQHVINDEKNYQSCILELANLLSNIAQNLSLERDNRYNLTFADEILEFLKNTREEKDPKTIVPVTEGIEKWYESNPISIEQCVEVLIAVINALLIREKQQHFKS